ncbi:hypothetical protein FH972_018201 [Carpinus fangiana]|uniref:Uncharacterized protein n=1 Tax=Carpinus fangiana TaxID=176857 RepID=A0A5N6RLS5_9ROSI|nr:hypothetical protein FH972_018201 [Carpinus fangiana]
MLLFTTQAVFQRYGAPVLITSKTGCGPNLTRNPKLQSNIDSKVSIFWRADRKFHPFIGSLACVHFKIRISSIIVSGVTTEIGVSPFNN